MRDLLFLNLLLEDAVSDFRQFLATESLLKMIENTFILS